VGTPCLVLEELTKEFGGLIAVDHLNLEIGAASITESSGPTVPAKRPCSI